ncbi:uncharacterized protein LOC130733222 [Lotus japonicus]|uniref:uncharacterized protein LOC130733222 n=1 Tax=Lotus japonicus TaxID=34305 RepID=UPI0025870D5E|nr:uncharacterized protein LOC130733222 [Lotus japonicus]XP_057441327.1 uncharacterized protein LOC130733222 [Lotus japonicus]
MTRYFSESKYMDCRTAISTFSQSTGESLREAWERYKSMLRRCPNHDFDAKTQIHLFRKGLQQQSRIMVDATSGGSLMTKSPTEAIQIIEAMALNDHQDQHNRGPPRIGGVLELGSSDAILAQNKQLQQQLDEVKKTLSDLPKQLREMQDSSSRKQVNRCDVCTKDHPTEYCQLQEEEVHYLGNQQRQGYQNNYPRGGNQQYNQPWRQDAGPSTSRAPPPYQNQSYQQPPQSKNPTLEDTMNQFMQMTMTNQKNTEASIKNLEIQMGQLAKQVAESHKGAFTANTEPNPNQKCNAIFTRSGKAVGRDIDEVVSEKNDRGEEKEKMSDNEEIEREVLKNKSDSVNKQEKSDEEKTKEKCEEKVGDSGEKRKVGGKENAFKDKEKVIQKPPLEKRLPYPHAPTKADKERQFTRFMDIFKRLQINIPFAEALEQMPTYAKFMKELLTKKRKFQDEEVVHLGAHCSSFIQHFIPEKMDDPGNVTIPVTIGTLAVGKALIDLGASISLMPLSIMKKACGMELRPTRMSLQLADRSIKYPVGIAEDVLVRVDKFLIPADFAIIDIPEDEEVPIILGRPFMRTARMAIDMDIGKLKVRVQDDEVQFDLYEAIQHPKDKGQCFKIDAIDEVCREADKKPCVFDPLEVVLINMCCCSQFNELEEKEIEKCVQELNLLKEIPSEKVVVENIMKEEPVEADTRKDDQKMELKLLPAHLKYVFL